MAAIYTRWIKAGRMGIEDVPEKWRSEVSALLSLQGDETL